MSGLRVCVSCGKKYTGRPEKKSRKVCSDNCYKNAKSAELIGHVRRACGTCKKEMILTQSKKNQAFCSAECFGESIRKEPKKTIKCKGCNATFEKNSCSPKVFCSSQCKERFYKQESRSCEYCNDTFKAYRYQKNRFCSKACVDESQSKNSLIKRNCDTCDSVYETRDVKSRFCSLACSHFLKAKAITTLCNHCGETFLAEYLPNRKHRIFCSNACRLDSAKKKGLNRTRNCDYCGVAYFAQHNSPALKNDTQGYCSRKCKGMATSGSKSHLYKGGRYLSESNGMLMVLVDRDTYKPEHRLIAESIIGRELSYKEEPIIHLNGVKHDNRPENLYIFSSMELMGLTLQRYDYPMPFDSNLSPLTYCVKVR